MKSKFLFGVIFILTVLTTFAQNKYEQEFRIPESKFPSNALELVSPYMQDAKRIRFYKEVDSIKKSFEVKFKKGRLHYSVEFDPEGQLEDVEFRIKEIDIPEESWKNIQAELHSKFGKVRIKKIQQQYPINHADPGEVLQEAFQNLILPYINYEVVFASKGKKGFQTYEGLFGSEGKLLKIRQFLPASYDHILY